MKFNIKRVLLLAITFGTIAAWNYILISEWFEYRGRAESFKQDSARIENLEEQIRATANQMSDEQILEKLNEIKNNMFQNLRVADSNSMVIAFLSKAASSIGITEVWPTLKETKIAARYAENTWEKTRLEISFRSRYHEAARLINILEQSPYLIDIGGFSINRGKKDPTGPIYAKVIANIYRLR